MIYDFTCLQKKIQRPNFGGKIEYGPSEDEKEESL
jgi:hypothetical protein